MEMDEPSASRDGSDASSDDESSQSEPELMITTRERRKTAGNKYSQVVAQEQADEEDDDVALLFQELEEEEDEEYNSAEADDEADMSSSDDDDQGPNAVADDADGEKELQRQTKIEKQRKRKADMALTTMDAIRKKPKLDPTALHRAPEKKPSKRKERVSWLPDQSAAPGRTSLRKQTVAHREVLLKNLQEQEEQRLKNKAHREEKERKKLANAPKELTQADRLAEAEKNERRNAKSLNRWETMEKQRAEEQAARLAALKDRKMYGSVVTFYSTKHTFRGPKIEDLSSHTTRDEQLPKKRGPKPKTLLQLSGALTSPHVPVVSANATPLVPNHRIPVRPAVGPPNQQNSWLAGIHEYAVQPASGTATPQDARSDDGTNEQKTTQSTSDVPRGTSHVLPAKIVVRPQVVVNIPPRPIASQNMLAAQNSESRPPSPSLLLPSVAAHTQPLLSANRVAHQLSTGLHPDNNMDSLATSQASTPISAQLAIDNPVLEEVIATRNLVILQDFEDLAYDAKHAYDVFNNTKRTAKPVKHVVEICPISGLTAKYRDKKTGVPFANLAASKRLKELQKHQYQWSVMLGCYIGRVGHVARGVPDGFLGT